MDKEFVKNLSFIFVGVALSIGASLIVNQFTPPSTPTINLEKETTQKPRQEYQEEERPAVQKPVYQTCTCANEVAKIARKIDDIPHGITESALNSAVNSSIQKALNRRPCITYKELEKHFIPKETEYD